MGGSIEMGLRSQACLYMSSKSKALKKRRPCGYFKLVDSYPNHLDRHWKLKVTCFCWASKARRKALIQFCSCQFSDQTRLIYMGYIGGSPKYPQTAFSIRLLRFYHLLWKFCSTRRGPFARALDEFLDAWNPLIITKNEEVSDHV